MTSAIDSTTAATTNRMPGAKLPEHRLAAIFHVSRERVRKVLHRLVAERRLEAIPQRGVFVPKPTVEEIARVYLAHRVFEAGVIAELARQPDAFIAAEQRLAIDNIGNVAPLPFSVWLFASHPPAVERIQMAKEWQRRHSVD